MDFSCNIEDYDLVFLDVETTGLSVTTGDAICEIGALKVKRREVSETFHTLVNPQRSIPYQAYLIHKISDSDLENAPVFEQIADKFVTFLNSNDRKTVICGYNIKFDLSFINYQLKFIGYNCLDFPVIDILKMARKSINTNRYSLESIVRFLNIQHKGNLHRALEDAFAGSQVFFKLVDRLEKEGVSMPGEFISFQNYL